MPIHTYANWNSRFSDNQNQIEPYRKYFFICEGANTETFYFKKLIDLRKQLGIHPLIDIRLWEKTGNDKNISFAKNLFVFAQKQKDDPANGFDKNRDKMIIVFDGDIFEEKVQGFDQLLLEIEKNDIAAITNPNFELFLLLHIENTYDQFIKGHEQNFFEINAKKKYSHPYDLLLKLTGINAKTNPNIGVLAENIFVAIDQEKLINQDIHKLKGKVTSNIGNIIESIINEKPNL